MDDDKKNTLLLIEYTASLMDPLCAGKILIETAYDWLEDGDLISAKRTLSKISHEYIQSIKMIDDMNKNKVFSNKIACLMDIFGVYLNIFTDSNPETFN